MCSILHEFFQQVLKGGKVSVRIALKKKMLKKGNLREEERRLSCAFHENFPPELKRWKISLQDAFWYEMPRE